MPPGDYSGAAPYVIDPHAGLDVFLKNRIQNAPGCNTASNDTSQIADAVDLASKSDVTVLLVGLDGSQEGETKDRLFVRLPGVQNELVEKVSAAANGTVILVAIGGGAMDLSAAKANPNIHAIMWVGYPGKYIED